MRKGSGWAPGKAILFGEHFVVYGSRAIAVPLSAGFKVEIGRGKPLTGLLREAAERIATAMDVDLPEEVLVEAEIPGWAGLGGSAAFSVALVRALASAQGFSPSLEELRRWANEGEKVFHGNPSGVDVAVSSLQKPVVFRRGEEPRQIKVKGTYALLYSGERKSSTKALVEKVSQTDEDLLHQLTKAADLLVEKALPLLEKGEAIALGKLMDLNHGLLLGLGVSTPALEKAVWSLRRAGALGAKLTGAGGGGCAIGVFLERKALPGPWVHWLEFR